MIGGRTSDVHGEGDVFDHKQGQGDDHAEGDADHEEMEGMKRIGDTKQRTKRKKNI